jgi:hypothetical protein
MAEWINSHEVNCRLSREGWLTPDSYSKEFSPLPQGPAVYLFALFRDDFTDCLVAYVGMSSNLQQRMSRHEVLAEIKKCAGFVKRWFRPTPAEILRVRERELIAAFDPPWNIIGRKKGVLS